MLESLPLLAQALARGELSYWALVDAPVFADPDQPGESILEGGARVSAETSRRLAARFGSGDASRLPW